MNKIYKPAFRYKKAGVMLFDLLPAGVQQGELFGVGMEPETDRRGRLLSLLDSLNEQIGQGTLRFAAEGTEQPWKMRRGSLTPGYTSEWDGLVVARA